MNDFNELHALYHHGIKGQKWGIRRFQNEDGTLTEEGKARYGANSVEEMNKTSQKIYNIDRKKALKDALKERKQLSKEVGKETADNQIKEKFGKITAEDIMKADKNSKIGKNVAKGAGIVAGSAALTVGAIMAGLWAGSYAVVAIIEGIFHSDDEGENL